MYFQIHRTCNSRVFIALKMVIFTNLTCSISNFHNFGCGPDVTKPSEPVERRGFYLIRLVILEILLDWPFWPIWHLRQLTVILSYEIHLTSEKKIWSHFSKCYSNIWVILEHQQNCFHYLFTYSIAIFRLQLWRCMWHVLIEWGLRYRQ